MNAKKIAAVKAVEFVENGMIVGLGTGSTANYAIEELAQRVKDGLAIKAVASSINSEALARGLGIEIIAFSEIDFIDIDIDGADEVDNNLNLIKGGGGSLLREKILAYHSKKFIVIVDETKMVTTLGSSFPLPVEIIPFAAPLTIKKLESLHCKPQLRKKNDQNYITDNGNFIVDCAFEQIADPLQLATAINLIPGVVENGLFMHNMVSTVIIGYNDGNIQTRSNTIE